MTEISVSINQRVLSTIIIRPAVNTRQQTIFSRKQNISTDTEGLLQRRKYLLSDKVVNIHVISLLFILAFV